MTLPGPFSRDASGDASRTVAHRLREDRIVLGDARPRQASRPRPAAPPPPRPGAADRAV
ncbi:MULTISPECIES: hypothetical protein [unclassified Streptomyces]|uniref:hypothetical protein n=1 Tax=unclassified Streptomyces TaxID=2593676 RepID=UPI001E525367|nr:hypothetical protein [Streptomyces sp. MBT42]MCD2464288.1 hypothetical protein [Streptomyces sp. MBT42]